MNKQNLDFA